MRKIQQKIAKPKNYHFGWRHLLLRQMYESPIVEHERVSTPNVSHLPINIIINNDQTFIINNINHLRHHDLCCLLAGFWSSGFALWPIFRDSLLFLHWWRIKS